MYLINVMLNNIFIILLCTSCYLFSSCQKELPGNNTIVNPSPPPPPPQPTSFSPQVAFWIDADYTCLCNGDPITISINNVSKILYDYPYGGVKDCLSPYTVRFDLNPGTYSWKAVRGSDSTGGSINIPIGCELQEIVF